jgi:hypothetical protein
MENVNIQEYVVSQDVYEIPGLVKCEFTAEAS